MLVTLLLKLLVQICLRYRLVEEILPIGTLSKFEQEALEAMLPTLRADIELGEKFING